MKNILYIANIIVSLAIIFFILIQGRGGGLGSAWGGGGETFQTRRGIEKITLKLTVAFIIIFFIISLISFFIK